MKEIYVLDASGYLFKAYYAIRNMTNVKGQSTNALFGFVRSVLKLINDFHPTHLVAVFDGENNSAKRKKIYQAYKAHRSECPPDLGYQIEWSKKFCEYMGIPHLDIPEVEADDTMGSVASWSQQQGIKCYLCTSDKDLAQLVNDNIHILNTHKDNLFIGPEKVKENFGVTPSQMVDYLAIVGDASDNIPGLPGFGPKTAAALLEKYHDLETLLSNANSLKGKQKNVVEEHADQARLSKELVVIDQNVPIPQEEPFYSLKSPDQSKVQEFYHEMGFKSLLKEFHSAFPSETDTPKAYHLINDLPALKKLTEILAASKEICFDTETTGIRPMLADLVGIGFSIKENEAYYIPTNGNLSLDEVLAHTKPLFENKNIAFFGHNVKYDLHVLNRYDIHVANVSFDTILASYLLNAQQRQHSLDALAMEYFQYTKIGIDELIGKGKKAITLKEVSIDKVCTYCCEDADITFRLKQLLAAKLKERELEHLFYDIELPLLSVLVEMEKNGIYIDIPYMHKMSEEIEEEMKSIEQEVISMAGINFNLNSPKQVSEVLFTHLKIKPPKKTATGFSTNAAVLEFLQHEYPIAAKIMQHRLYAKLRSTYLETLPLQVNPSTERIHCTFNQSVTATGRLSSQDPNLQNIPIRSDIGKKIRHAFRPQKKGWSYVSADYSQIELRLVAHMSEDPKLIEAFHQNQDVHKHTASVIFGIPIEQVTPEQRYQAKAVNFGVIYGQQAFGLSRELGIDTKEAAAFIETYFVRYQKVKEFIESCKERAKLEGKAVTVTGRERAIPEIYSKNAQIRNAAERLAINTPLQGSAADLIKLAMLRIDSLLKQQHSKTMMVLQIHDELLFEAPDDELPQLIPLIREGMEGVWNFRVPLTVDINIGKNWEEC
ncbi:MAG: DNA polymerase I [Chlamydiales bacterium]